MNNQLSQNHWGVSLLFLMICSATFVTCEGFIDPRGFFSLVLSVLPIVPANLSGFIFYCFFMYPLLIWTPCCASKSSHDFLCLVHFVHFLYLSYPALCCCFRYIYFSFASHSVFESRLYVFSSLILLSRNWYLLLNSYMINHWPKLGLGIERILEIIQPVSLYLPTYDHWDLQSLNATPKVIYPGGSLTFFLELIPEHLSLQFFAHRTDNIRCCPEVGTHMKILENRWRHPRGRSMTRWLVESDGDVRTCTDTMFTSHGNIEHHPSSSADSHPWAFVHASCSTELFLRTTVHESVLLEVNLFLLNAVSILWHHFCSCTSQTIF